MQKRYYAVNPTKVKAVANPAVKLMTGEQFALYRRRVQKASAPQP
jgi:hypothetical protein